MFNSDIFHTPHIENMSDFFKLSVPFIFNELPFPIIFINKSGNICAVNKAFFNHHINLSPSNIINTHILELDPNSRLPIIIKTGLTEIDENVTLKNGKKALIYRIPIFCANEIIGAIELFIVDNLNFHKKPLNKFQSHKPKYTFSNILTQSPTFKDCIVKAKSYANTSLPVLIYGETGVGKELFAHSIHNASTRSEMPFVSINCAAIPESLVESEFFGYSSGSFTGASKKGKLGKFQLANNGTLFLDEIGDLPITMQGKLLRVLEENQIEPIGSNNIININVKIIAATNRNLEQLIDEKKFRADLFYRLNVLNLNIPPLRKRKCDISLLVEHFTNSFCKKSNFHKKFSNNVINLLMEYDWPGNIRELKNVIERMIVTSSAETINIENIPKYVLRKCYNKSLYNNLSKNNESSLNDILNQVESKVIRDALQLCENNKVKAANILGIPRMTLYRKLKKLEANT